MATNSHNKVPIGVSFPIQRGSSGYFSQTWITSDVIKSQITMLLNTRKGERRMNPDFGSSLWEILFDMNVDDIPTLVESAIKRDVERWLPYVTIQSINVQNNLTDRDNNRIIVSLSFTSASAGIDKEQILNINFNNSDV